MHFLFISESSKMGPQTVKIFNANVKKELCHLRITSERTINFRINFNQS